MSPAKLLAVKIAVAAALTLSAGGAIALVVPLPGTRPPVPTPAPSPSALPVNGLGEGGAGIQASIPSPSPAPSPVASLGLTCHQDHTDLAIPSLCTVTSLNGFSGVVTLACLGLKSGMACNIQPERANLAPGQSVQFKVVFISGPGPSESQSIQLRASSGNVSVTITTLAGGNPLDGTQPAFLTQCNPFATHIVAGTQIHIGCSVDSKQGFSGPVHLACEPMPGVACTLSELSVTPPPNGSAPYTLTLSTPRNAPNAHGIVTVRGSNPSALALGPAGISLTVMALTFTFSCPPPPRPGNTPNPPACFIANQSGGDLGTISLACTVEGMPSATCSFNPSSVTMHDASGGSVIMVLGVPPGTYTVDLTARSDLYTDSEKAAVTISPPASPTPGPTHT